MSFLMELRAWAVALVAGIGVAAVLVMLVAA